MAGEVLKKRREELGLDLKQTADRLRIREDYLASIEEDCFGKLPVAVYTMGYIRSYAAYLNIDPEPIIALYTGHLEVPKPSTIFPVASSKKKIPYAMYAIPLLGALVIVFGIVILRQERPDPGKREMPQAPVSEAMRETATQPEMQRPVTAAPAAGEKEQRSNAATALPVSRQAGGHSLEIVADDLTWLSARYANGSSEELLLRPGTTRTLQFSGQARLKIGNAGGIRMVLDGTDLGSPGSLGQVITLEIPGSMQPENRDR